VTDLPEEPCTWRLAPHELISATYEPCANCGHTMLVHGGVHNSALTECVICMMLVDVAEFRVVVRAIAASDDHEPVDHTGGREKPSATVRMMRCMICNGRLVPNFDETGWMHQRTDRQIGTDWSVSAERKVQLLSMYPPTTPKDDPQ
jgi:hypothetical protein